jgi:hypothetical protein
MFNLGAYGYILLNFALGTKIFLSQVIFFAFVWLLITCLGFSFVSFIFLFSLNWLLVCVVNALIKGEIEDQSVRGLVDGRSWL